MTDRSDIKLCGYTWDFVGDETAGPRAAATGAAGVALAAVYHSVRAATPFHPGHRLVEATTAAAYFPIRKEAWRGHRLVPNSADHWAGADSYANAASALMAAGLTVEPWVVLTHSSALGSANPSLCVTNAFGDVYPYALCPSSEDVIQYAATLIAECASATAATSMMVEACGPLGVSHLGHHEKTAGAEWSPTDEALLSICFCASCINSLRDAGVDTSNLRVLVSEGIGSGAENVESVLGELASAVLDARSRARRRLAHAVAVSARSAWIEKLTFHAQMDPWATGPFSATKGLGEFADGFILPGDAADTLVSEPNDDARPFDDVRNLALGRRVGAYVNALPPVAVDQILTRWPLLASEIDDLYVYHFGLLSARRLDTVSEAIRLM